MGAFLLPWQPNQEADHHNFSYFELPLPKQLLYQIRVTLLQWFRSCHLKKSFFKIECCRGNQTKWQPVIKHINWVDNHQMIITAKYGSHHFTGIEKVQFNHFPIISLWELSVAMATKPRGRLPNFMLFGIVLNQATFVPNESPTASVVLEELSFNKWLFLKFNVAMATKQKSPCLIIKHINWVENQQKIINAKYGSHHFTGYGENTI